MEPGTISAFAVNLRGEFGRVARNDPHRRRWHPARFLRTCEPIFPVGVVRDDHASRLYRTVYIRNLETMKDAAMRGDKLSEHILWTAKNVFLEVGFERASMDVIASPGENLQAHPLRSLREQGKALPSPSSTWCAGWWSANSKMPGDYPGDADGGPGDVLRAVPGDFAVCPHDPDVPA